MSSIEFISRLGSTPPLRTPSLTSPHQLPHFRKDHAKLLPLHSLSILFSFFTLNFRLTTSLAHFITTITSTTINIWLSISTCSLYGF